MRATAWKAYALGLLSVVCWSTHGYAQAPVGAAAAGAAAPAAAPASPTLWTFLGFPPAGHFAKNKAKFCNSACGKIYGALVSPMAAFSGGLITNRCEIPTAEDLAQPPESAGGAAARVKADALAAKQRRADVRYLGTVDCKRWPEVELALINALRGDRNECVRLEAALVLGRGCCCTPKTAEALSIVVAGSKRDGFPVERSARVRNAAGVALDHCLACLKPQEPILPGEPQPIPLKAVPKKVKPDPTPRDLPLPNLSPAKAKGDGTAGARNDSRQEIKQISYYEKVEQKGLKPVLDQARKALGRTSQATTAAKNSRRAGTGGLFEIARNAFRGSPAANAPTTVQGNQPISGVYSQGLARYQAPEWYGQVNLTDTGTAPDAAVQSQSGNQVLLPASFHGGQNQNPARNFSAGSAGFSYQTTNFDNSGHFAPMDVQNLQPKASWAYVTFSPDGEKTGTATPNFSTPYAPRAGYQSPQPSAASPYHTHSAPLFPRQ